MKPLKFSRDVRDALISESAANTRPRTSTPKSITPSTSANSGGGTNVRLSATRSPPSSDTVRNSSGR
jgi:hypothetical protein